MEQAYPVLYHRYALREGSGGAKHEVTVWLRGAEYTPVHLSKEQDINLVSGDQVQVNTPGGGGYGAPFARPPEDVAHDVALGRYTVQQAKEFFGVLFHEDAGALHIDVEKTVAARSR